MIKTLELRKKSNKVWLNKANDQPDSIISKFYVTVDGLEFQVVEQGQARRNKYLLGNITVYDDTSGGVAETFSTIEALMLRLEALKYPAFFNEGESLIEAFTDLTDTPSSYSGQGGKVVSVKLDASGLEFTEGGSGSTPTLKEVLGVGDREMNPALDGDSLIGLEAHINLVTCEQLTGNTTFIVPTIDDFLDAFPTYESNSPEFKILNNSAFTITLEGDTGVTLIGDVLQIPQNAVACVKYISGTDTWSVTYQTNSVGGGYRIILMDTTPLGSAITGGNNVLVKSWLIPANTLKNNAKYDFEGIMRAITLNSTKSISFNKNTSNTMTGATQIGRTTSFVAGANYLPIKRQYVLRDGNLIGISTAFTNTTDESINTTSNNLFQSFAFDPTVDNYLIFAMLTSNASDTFNLHSMEINETTSKTTI